MSQGAEISIQRWAEPAGRAPREIFGSPKSWASFTLLPWAGKTHWPTGTEVDLTAWAAGTPGCLMEGPMAITGTYFRSRFCCLHHVRKHINCLFLSMVTTERKCTNVHCLAGFYPVSTGDSLVKRMAEFAHPHKIFIPIWLMISKASKKFLNLSLVLPAPRQAICCPTEKQKRAPIFLVSVRVGLPALCCPFLSKPGGRAAWEEQLGACILPQCNIWSERQMSWITNSTFRGGNNWNVSAAGEKNPVSAPVSLSLEER